MTIRTPRRRWLRTKRPKYSCLGGAMYGQLIATLVVRIIGHLMPTCDIEPLVPSPLQETNDLPVPSRWRGLASAAVTAH